MSTKNAVVISDTHRETEMEKLELGWVTEEISFYKNSDYKWVRELAIEYEIYFDKEFRRFFTESWGGEMPEFDFRKIFLFSIDTLYNIITINDFYLEGDGYTPDPHPEINLLYLTKKKELHLNKEKAERLFIRITMPFRIFEKNINKQLLRYYSAELENRNLNQDNQLIKTNLAKIESRYETSEKNLKILAGDMQKEKRESIEGMIRAYIKTCEFFDTGDPKIPDLAVISGVAGRLWKTVFSNTGFLYANSLALTSKRKQSKEKRELWLEAFQKNETRLKNALSDASKKAEYSSNVNYDNPEAESKQQKIKAEDIKAGEGSKKTKSYEIKKCGNCGTEIKFGTECSKCKKEFPTIKPSNLKRTKKAIESEERVKKAIEELKAKKLNETPSSSKE